MFDYLTSFNLNVDMGESILMGLSDTNTKVALGNEIQSFFVIPFHFNSLKKNNFKLFFCQNLILNYQKIFANLGKKKTCAKRTKNFLLCPE